MPCTDRDGYMRQNIRAKTNGTKLKGAGRALERYALYAAEWTGSSAAFLLAAFTIVLWLALGPFLRFSDAWQLAINTGTTIVTFLMVFLIQRVQNKDSRAIHAKLNEIVA